MSARPGTDRNKALIAEARKLSRDADSHSPREFQLLKAVVAELDAAEAESARLAQIIEATNDSTSQLTQRKKRPYDPEE